MSGADPAGRDDFPPIEALIPHRGSVVLLDRILSHDADATEVRVSIARQEWLKDEDGSVAAWLTVEYMAQCVAAHEGLLALDEGRPPPAGFLVGVSGLRVDADRYAPDAVLRVTSRRVRGRPSLGALSHRCEVYLESGGALASDFASDTRRASVSSGSDRLDPVPRGRPVAEGRLSVSVPRDGASG